jgi:phosphoglycolate phosphatase
MPTVVFDLDGTLVDTAPDLVATLNQILGREGLPPVDYGVARKMIGGGARAMIERGLLADGRPPEQSIDRLVADFIDLYASQIAERSQPFPQLETVLDELAARGCKLAVCTNKLEWLSVRLLDALGLSGRFAAVCGADTFGVSKPNPKLLFGAIARAGGRADAALMVGDSATDVAAARAAGIPVVAVDYGYTEIPAAELGADRVISTLTQLPEAVFELVSLA